MPDLFGDRDPAPPPAPEAPQAPAREAPLYYVVRLVGGAVRLLDANGRSPNGWDFVDAAGALNYASSAGILLAWDYSTNKPSRAYPGPVELPAAPLGMGGTL